jgi:hypothetical protein
VWVVTRECSKNDDASANPGRDLTEPNMKWPAGVRFFLQRDKYTSTRIFLYIFKKSFFKNILRFGNFTLLASIRCGPRRLGCRRGVRNATDGGMERPSNRCAPQRLHVAYRHGPRRLVFLINERNTHLQWNVRC